MRDYAKVSPQFWIGSTGKALRKAGAEAQIVAMYLMTSPHANMLGLYWLPELYIAAETGLSPEGASKGLRRAIEAGFCRYDEESEMVWVVEMAQYQIAERLEPTDKRCKGIQKELESLPNNPFSKEFLHRYAVAFNLNTASPSEAPSKPLRSQEQEQEQEQEQDAADAQQQGEQHQPANVVTLTAGNRTAFAQAVAAEYGKAYGVSAPPVPLMLAMEISSRADWYPKAADLSWWADYFALCWEDPFLTDRPDTTQPLGRKAASFKYLVSEECMAAMIARNQREAAHG